MGPSPHCREPRHLDIIISHGSHPATGTYDLIIETGEQKVLQAYPVLFLDEDDTDFLVLKKRVSGRLVPSKICPVGKLELVWKVSIDK